MTIEFLDLALNEESDGDQSKESSEQKRKQETEQRVDQTKM